MEKEEKGKLDERWKKFLENHWKMALILVVGIIGAILGAIFVFLWRVSDAQATGMVPSSIGLWTVGYAVTFILNVILWEALIIGIPVVVAVILVVVLWWNKLPEEEKEGYKREPPKGWRRRRTSMGGGGGGVLILIAWLLVVWIDNMWNTAFQDWTFNYWVYSGLIAVLWIAIIFGIPIVVLGSLWLLRELKKES